MKNLKDKLTNIAALLIVAGGFILGLEAKGVVLSPDVTTAAVVAVSLGGAIIGYFTGKTPDGKVKTEDAIAKSSN